MIITKEYLPEKGVVVITVENPPLATTKHTIMADALADGRVDLSAEIARLQADADAKLVAHNAILEML